MSRHSRLQYATSKMTKRAFLVGLNAYAPPINLLRGCVNDVYQIKDILHCLAL